MNQELTTQGLLKAIQANQKSSEDILEAINVFASDTQDHFEKIDDHLKKVDGRLDHLESDVANIKETMVTQAIFQRSLDSVEDRLTTEIKGQNRKLIAVVRLLEQKNIFSSQEVQELFA